MTDADDKLIQRQALAGMIWCKQFYYYDIPALTGVSLPMDRFLVDAPRAIPTLVGIKFTNPDLVSYRRSLDVAGERLDLPWGVDEMLLPALATGARGGVGSTYNWAPRLYRDLITAFNRGDLTEARRLQSISIAMIDAIGETESIVGISGKYLVSNKKVLDNIKSGKTLIFKVVKSKIQQQIFRKAVIKNEGWQVSRFFCYDHGLSDCLWKQRAGG